jgi:hypothetical protein
MAENDNGGLTIRLSKLSAGIISTALSALVVGFVVMILRHDNMLQSLNEWRQRSESTVQRTEMEFREKVLFAEIEKVRTEFAIAILEHEKQERDQ